MLASKGIRYFLGHLTSSIFLWLLLVVLVFLVWYPTPLAHAEGVTVIFFNVTRCLVPAFDGSDQS